MKKILITLVFVLFSVSFVSAESTEYFQGAVYDFINSPNAEDLDKIEDLDLRYCEEVFLKAYMRRDFTEEENEKCRNIFAQKIESEMNFKKYVLQNREVY